MPEERICVAFVGDEILMRGEVGDVAVRAKAVLDAGEERRVVLFDDESGAIVDLDFSGTTLVPRSTEKPPRQPGRGRPRLGVVSREISLLPRHWEWLSEQSGGASATLRRLVDAARKNDTKDAVQRRAIDAAHRFLWDIAGNLPHFEEATRALFAKDFERLRDLVHDWPSGIREQLLRFVERAGVQ